MKHRRARRPAPNRTVPEGIKRSRRVQRRLHRSLAVPRADGIGVRRVLAATDARLIRDAAVCRVGCWPNDDSLRANARAAVVTTGLDAGAAPRQAFHRPARAEVSGVVCDEVPTCFCVRAQGMRRCYQQRD